jgi:prepilin-type processing-associated H-X9-DG protein
MKFSPRQAMLGLAVAGLLAVFAALDPRTHTASVSAAPAADQPLDRVPADAGLFIHFRAGDLWDSNPTILGLRKDFAKELEPALKAAEKETGLRPENLNSLTFHFPKIPQGPGDEQLFVVQVSTKKPYDKQTVLAGLRRKGETAKDGVVKLQQNFVLHLTSDTQFTVLHESLLDEFKKGPPKAKDGVMADAIKAAREGKNALVFGLDPSGLPAELFSAAPPELQPFLPLLKSKSIILQANLDKKLTAEFRFIGENEEKAIDSERSFNLLMKLAEDGIGTLLKDEKQAEDLKPLLPTLTEIQKVVSEVKAKRDGNVTTATVAINADPALAKPLVNLVLKPQMASARARSSNNLKQIGLALHNYHDKYGAFPPAAIVDKKGKALLSWRVAILPFIEQDNLYKQFKLDEPWDSEHNIKLSKKLVKVYSLPYGEPKKGEEHYTNYRVFVGNGAAFDTVQGVTLPQFTDGTSNTLLAFEAAEATPWAKPDEIEFDPKQQEISKHFRFQDGKVCMVLFADGSVRAFPNTIADNILKLLIQRDDGMVIPDF